MTTRKKSSAPAKDEDFYSSLAADINASEEDSSVSDADVAALTKALADMDDMDDALFSSSLKPKKTPSKSSTTKKDDPKRDPSPLSRTTPSPAGLGRRDTFTIDSGLEEDDIFKTHDLGKRGGKGNLPEASKKEEGEKPSTLSKTAPVRSKPQSKTFDFGEFDEDDPLAGLLSDEDDPKPKKKTSKTSLKAGSQKLSTSAGGESQKVSDPTPSVTQKESTDASPSGDSIPDDTGPGITPRGKGAKGAGKQTAKQNSKKNEDIDFGDDDDLLGGLGFDETPREKSTRHTKVDEEQLAAKAKVNELFGKTSILDKPPASKARTREFQLDSKYKKPQTAPASKEPKEEDFTFGGYTPSAVVSTRPDSAPPGRRSVRFAENKEDDDDIFGSSTMDRPRRPGGSSRLSSATSSPSKSAKTAEDNDDDWLSEAAGLGSTFPMTSKQKATTASKKQPSKLDADMDKMPEKAAAQDEQKRVRKEESSKPVPKNTNKAGGEVAMETPKRPASAADYLGLGGDEIDVDSIALPKQVTPRSETSSPRRGRLDDMFSVPAKRDTTSPFPWDSDGPGRARKKPGDLSSTGDLGSTFDSTNFDDDDDNDPLGESDPMRASLIAQQLKQLAALERNEPLPTPEKAAPPSSTSATRDPAPSGGPPTAIGQQSAPPSSLGPPPSKLESGRGMSATAPLQRQSSSTSLPTTDPKPSPSHGQPTAGRREPKWRQEMHQRQQQHQQAQGGTPATPPQLPTKDATSTTPATLASGVMPLQRAEAPPAQSTSGTSGPLPMTPGYGVDSALLAGNQQLEKQRQAMLDFEATLKQQQAQMAAEHEKQMRAIQEQQQKAMLQQQQQVLQQQQQQQQQALQQQQQQLLMQQQMLQSGPATPLVAGLGLGGGGASAGGGQPSLGFGAGVGTLGVASQSPWMENKLRQLEAEKSQLEASAQLAEKHHRQQVETLEAGHRDYVALLEENARRREARIQREAEDASGRSEERLKAVIAERTTLVSEHQARMDQVYQEHGRELEQLKQMHRQELEALRIQWKREVEDTRRTMQQHLDSMKDSTGHTQSLKAVVERVGAVGEQVNSLQDRMSEQHRSQLDNRLQDVREKEEEMKRMRKRLEEQEAETSLERERLQATVSRLEAHIKEQNLQLDEERWRLRQEQNKLSSLQRMVEEERKVMSEQLASQQTSLQQAKNAVLAEQQSIMGQCLEERKSLAAERAQLAAARREWEGTMKEGLTKASQEQASREGALQSLSEERSRLAAAREALQRDAADLDRRGQELERQEAEMRQERGRLQRLGATLQARSSELQGMVSDAVSVREEGEAALVKARKVEGEQLSRQKSLEHHLEELRATERRIAEDRLQLAEEQRSLERSLGSTLCQQCGLSLSMQGFNRESNPLAISSSANLPPRTGYNTHEGGVIGLLPTPGGDPMPTEVVDRLLAQAELDRTRNIWKLAAEKDKEFLEEETSFLESLNGSFRLGPPAVT